MYIPRFIPAGGGRRQLAVLAACLLTLPVAVSTGQASAGEPGPAGTAAQHAPLQQLVTLITGDQVSVAGQEISVVQAERRMPVVFHRYTENGDIYVIPDDALPAVQAQTVDRELFNVTGLARQGITGTLPLIVIQHPGMRAALPAVARTVRALPSVNGTAVRVESGKTAEFWAGLSQGGLARAAATRVLLDRRFRPSLDVSVSQVGAPRAWQAGFDGSGVEVAVLDTGVDASHPDLSDRIVEARSFIDGDENPADVAGHGTHVASTIAGSGKVSGGRFKGVAPGAKIRSGRVCGTEYCEESAILAAMDWAAYSGAKVINMSLGGGPTDGTDLMSQRVNELTAETGVLFVIAAGNAGCAGCVGSPGSAEAALTVGAVDKAGQLASFSSRGPRWGNAGAKPEITAPGVAIMAARAHGMLPGYPGGEHYAQLSGTSMATPHVAGAAAILAQARPAARAGELKDALVSTAKDLGSKWFEQGAGRLDIPASLTALTGAASVNFGVLSSSQATRQAVYTNRSGRDVTVQLALAAAGWDGKATGAARLSTTQLRIPAGGHASVTITVDPGDRGVFGGVLTATADGVSLRTPVSWRSPYPLLPRHTITVTMLDHNGVPTPETFPEAVRDASETEETPNDPFMQPEWQHPRKQIRPGVWEINVPAGTYSVTAVQFQITPVSHRATLTIATDLLVQRDVAVTLDARKAVRASARTPDPAYEYSHELTYEVVGKDGGGVISVLVAFNGMHAELFATPVKAPKRGRVSIQETYTLGQQTVRASTGGAELAAGYEPYNVARALAGRHELAVASTVSPDLKGKAALLKLPAPEPGNRYWYLDAYDTATHAATVAQQKGAVALIFYMDVPGAKPLYPVVQVGLRAHSLPILSVSQADGERLYHQESLLQLDVKANPAYLYNLHYAPPVGIPAELAHRVDPAQLHKTRNRYHSDTPGMALHTWTMAFEKGRNATYVTGVVNLQGPAEVDQYVGGATGNQQWRRQAYVANMHGMFFQVDFEPWRDPVEDWFSGPLSMVAEDDARNTAFLRLAAGNGKDLLLTSRMLGDGSPGHRVNTFYLPMTYRLYAGQTEIPSPTAPRGSYFEIPATKATYRLEGTYTLPSHNVYDGGPNSSMWTHSTRVDNTWTFTTASPTEQQCPPSPYSCSRPALLQLRYQLGLDLDNRAKAGWPHLIRVQAYPQQTSAEGGRIAGLTLRYSTDAGATWKTAPAFGFGGRYLAILWNNAAGGTGVWIKTEAWDTNGNRVTQTIQHAYTLR